MFEPNIIVACTHPGCEIYRAEINPATDEITAGFVHGFATDHTDEELEVTEADNMPHYVKDVGSAIAWASLLVDCFDDPHTREALVLWCEDHHITDASDVDLVEFEIAYKGHFETFQGFAEELIEETGMLDGVPDQVAWFFDYEAFASDLENNYTVIESEIDSCVYVFGGA